MVILKITSFSLLSIPMSFPGGEDEGGEVTNGPRRIGNHFTAPLLGVLCLSTSSALGAMGRIQLRTA